MAQTSFDINATGVKVTGGRHSTVDITLECSLDDIIKACGKDQLLDAIGKDKAQDYFGLVEEGE